MLRFYRTAIWAPIALPAIVLGGVRVFGTPVWDPLSQLVAALITSLLYGAIPYAALAVWATWRVRILGESQIRRLALRAPLLMVVAFLPYALVIGALEKEPWSGGLALFGFGALYIVPLGYAYVAATFLARRLLRARIESNARLQAV